jgi:DNA-binding MarR family transcriptional regulator
MNCRMVGDEAGRQGMTVKYDARHLIVSLLKGFYWFDEGLQNYLRARGWPGVTRPQSMVMVNIVLGHDRPSAIARRMGVSRQAVHTTLGQLVALGLLALADDPDDRRNKVCVLTAGGEAMRRDAQAAMEVMAQELGRRTGKAALATTAVTLNRDWGPPLAFDVPAAADKAEA